MESWKEERDRQNEGRTKKVMEGEYHLNTLSTCMTWSKSSFEKSLKLTIAPGIR